MTTQVPDESRLANVHRVTTTVRGRAVVVYVFDHHRSAFTPWALAASRTGPLSLVSLDRHLDVAAPAERPPLLGAALEELDRFAREVLSPRNDDHVVAAMEAGAISDALLVARSGAPGLLDPSRPYQDGSGRLHRASVCRTLEDAAPVAEAMAGPLALDVDLDCFATVSDAQADEVIPWDEDHIEAFLRAPDAGRFWDAVLPRVQIITIAREPYHCGGITRASRLWVSFAEVFFRRVLQVPPP